LNDILQAEDIAQAKTDTCWLILTAMHFIVQITSQHLLAIAIVFLGNHHTGR
jgi:hypothetical protein